MQWPLVPYKLQGPVPLRDHPEVAMVMDTAQERNLACSVEPGLVIRILDVNDAWMVSYHEVDGVHTFHEANGCGWVWRAHELEDFILHLKQRRQSIVRKQAPLYNDRG